MKTNRKLLPIKTLLRIFTGLIITVAIFLSANAQTPGDLDPDFFGGRVLGLDSRQDARATAIQSDGKIIIVGHTAVTTQTGTNYNFAVWRYQTNGVIDSTFGANGIATADFPNGTDSGDFANAMVIQSDGKIVITGRSTTSSSGNSLAIARFNTNGLLDTSFDGDGKAITAVGNIGQNNGGTGIGLQSNGKIIVGGSANGLGAVRFNADGSLDATFANGAVRALAQFGDTPGSGYGDGNALTIQSDNKIIVAGNWNQRFVVARFTADGLLDPTFSSDGKQETDIQDGSDAAFAVAMQSDGKIVLAGNSNTFTIPATPVEAAAVRYNSNGSLDSSFGSNGSVITSAATGLLGNAIAVQSDGKIAVAVSNGGGSIFGVLRYNSNGALDATFNGNGINTGTQFIFPGTTQNANGLALQADGKIVSVGIGNGNQIAVARFNTNGTPDGTFGNRATTYYTDGQDQFESLALQSDGNIIAAASPVVTGFSRDFRVLRYTSDGRRDNSFGFGGVGLILRNGVDEFAKAVRTQGDNKIVIAGTSGDRCGIARLTSAGQPDTTFTSNINVDGFRTTLVGTSSNCSGLAIQAEGKLIVSGTGLMSGNNDFAIIRYNTNGALDTTFDTDGIVTTAVGAGFDESFDVAIQSDGKIVAVGKSDGFLSVVRYNSNGSLDTTFDGDGKLITPVTVSNADGKTSLALKSNGKIVLGAPIGNAGAHDFGIVRLNANGSLDLTFDGDGIVITNFGADDVISGIGVQSNGQIVAVGSSNLNGNYDFAAARYNFDGSLDTTFDLANRNIDDSSEDFSSILTNSFSDNAFDFLQTSTNPFTLIGDGKVVTPIGGANDRALAMLIQADDKIIAAGFAETNNAQGDFALTRYRGTPNAGTVETVTVQTNPSGRVFTVDGTTYTTAQDFKWATGSTHTISTTSPQSGTAGTQYVWANWSDGGAISHTVAPTAAATYTANFNTQYQLTMNAGTGGTVSPASGFYNAGQAVAITATANSGFTFANWTGTGSGSYSGTNNPASVTMNAPISQTASFNTQCSYSINPASAIIASSGGSGSFAVTAPSGCAWTAASGVNWIQVNSGSGSGNGTVAFTALGHNPFEPARTGTITVGGQTFTINQAGMCQWGFNPGVLSVTAAASTQTVSVGIQAGCDFTSFLSNQTPWITNLVSDINNQTLTFQLAANSGAARTGNIAIGAAILNVQQSAFGSPNDQPILFSTNRDGNNEIYRMNADGSNQQRLTNSTVNEGGAKWSFDGTKIFFSRPISSTQMQIWTMNADGTNQTLIVELAGSIVLHGWSPNNQKMLYGKKEASFVENLWTMNADGSNQTQITNAGTADHLANWSPDSSKIAFGRCTPSATLICDVFTMNADGSNQTNLTPTNPNDDDAPNWTPDGGKIVFGAQNTPDDYNVYIINANGTNRQQLTNAAAPQFYNGNAVSPNGNKIAITLRSSALTSFEVSTVNLDGSNLMNLTNNSVFDSFNAWSPDSAKIGFISRRDTSTGEIYTMNADGSGVVRLTFNTASDSITDWLKPTAPRRAPFDFDGDGKADLSVFRPDNGSWYIQQSTAGFTGLQFGISTDKLAPADFDGDGKTDVAVVRNGVWYLQRSQLGFTGIAFGDNNDIPVPADYDGDGKAEIAVFRPSNGYWYILNLANNQFTATLFGISTDKPVPADYDGDGKADVAVNRNGNWYIQRSQLGFTGILFGDGNDKTVPADYDGDGKADLAVFRPSNGTWYLLQSAAGFTGLTFGLGTDIPTAADYDGDGKADIAVVRNGNWYLQRSTAGFTGILFGNPTDKPIPGSFVR